MLLVHNTLFDSKLVNIRHAVARPSTAPCSRVEHGAADVILLPIAGVFAKHDSPTHYFIANANHALFFGYGRPYRISFPGGIGDESLVLRFSKEALATMLAETVGIENLYSPQLHNHCLLSPASMLDRDRLWRCLVDGVATPLAIEEICVSLLAASVKAAYQDIRTKSRTSHALTLSRRRRQVEIVKELISLDPAREWTLDALSHQANTSPYHLARVFREEVGVPVYQYLIRTRLGKTLEALRAADSQLTQIALDAGFSTHSHYSASFRSLFGISPSQFRSRINAL